jgi:hypothetical protein
VGDPMVRIRFPEKQAHASSVLLASTEHWR